MSTQNANVGQRQQANGKIAQDKHQHQLGLSLGGKNDPALKPNAEAQSADTLLNLIICAGGIYASFLTWGVLQERITTTNYGTTPTHREVFQYPVVVNTVQSLFAASLGYLYLLFTRPTPESMPVIPSRKILAPLCLVAIISSVSSPIGYASLQHVDYITFILAKSCKLLPVMFLHVTLYGKRYPFYKYAVVALVTAGVAIFTLQSGGGKKKKQTNSGNSVYGLVLLSINLLFDGLTNSTQDDIYAKFRGYTGKQMMVALNIMSTMLTTLFLLLSPYLAQTGVAAVVGISPGKGAGELWDAIAFIQRHPAVGRDILMFGAAGALGQVFIFMTLSIFGSLVLVTVTVTRKMLTMILSVVYFGHALTAGQWVGVGLVFGGVGIEGYLNKVEKAQKAREKKKA
ncbi:udp-glc gal endoplasmic reticulum nucleotide sugar transporter like protein [Zymoseptoria brevis]|uniref:UDP-galactose transporter homolog 1 n=1 Tax=Zymoseptoria brevis TaxID=1047168 RepID=A0A0F4GMI6_9PEZI|nr:udp-glc gal endoplasmic reticulum nucleotide sugar transporter like protein [Zymoseptoria brevis]